MKFTETKLNGAYLIDISPVNDERGYFARSFCAQEYNKYGLNSRIVQCNISHNHKKGTLRGMHYQINPSEEAKTVLCSKGAIFDVIIDLRISSSTYMKWISVELSEKKYNMLYIPEGFAHGFQTLCDDTVVFYQMSEFYNPQLARGIRYDDPAFNISWPLAVSVISGKDSNYPEFKTLTNNVDFL